ncbi:DUF4381 domain-containing protein [Hoeflea sp.]|uniref:DUF4381 domain-containing protein n=1 Tax=Hoeflea sp. TaxID=1940281 RepID=UPI003749C801
MSEPVTASLAPEIAAQLEQLKDIHLPEPISWWPLAPGWWALIGGVIVLIIATCTVIAARRRTVRYAALRQLQKLQAAQHDKPLSPELATEISVLLRRIALRMAPEQLIGPAHGEAWETYLINQPGGLPSQIAHYLAFAPYIPGAALAEGAAATNGLDTTAVFDAAAKWIRRNT